MKTLFTIGKLSVVTLFITSLYTPYLFANQSNFESDYFYAGAKFGSIRYQHGCEPWAISCDKRDNAFAGFFGYQFNDGLFIESSLIDLGEVNATYFESGLFVPYQGEMKAWDIALGYDLTLSDNFKAFTKVGVVNWYGKNSSPSFEIKDDGFSATASVGFKYDIADNWQARISYQYIDDLGSNKLGSSNGHIGWLGLSYQFKRQTQPEPQPITPEEKPQKVVEAKVIPAPVVIEATKVVPARSVTALFAFDSSQFKIPPNFNDFVDHIKTYPTTSITINAYTDSKGSVEYNQWLSKRRAEAIKTNLIKNGISESRISIAFFGEANPVIDNNTEEHRQLNRRAVITASEVEVTINKEVN
ncbi:OmpA family protein [Pseudoalteromonas sp. G4]|uniref:OmpA family protein n=1 Tax=Pseudoalteromonas sp. G4 TaxID=2992761 RepID=UPI00237E37A4|nr:OmpA family protein [Pseudoalteromonas sp. G4]MDE3271006.1 OmpA family protein [Pseudoalteromonas sp. G4]